MEILQLRYFFLSAKNESFSATAKVFDVPTTAVSSSVRRLEEELGCKLFDRTPNRITLNAKGRRLQQALCTVFTELDKAVEEISAEYVCSTSSYTASLPLMVTTALSAAFTFAVITRASPSILPS